MINMALSEHDKDEIRQIVKDEMKPFMDRVEPYLQGVAGLGIFWKLLVAIGSGLLIWAQIKGVFHS